MKAQIVDFLPIGSNRGRLTLDVFDDFRDAADKLQGGPIELTVKKWREKRSLDANAYAWVLIDRLSAELGIPKEEIYRHAIRSIGGVSETVCVMDKAVDKLCAGWSKNGLGWHTERFPSQIAGCTNVILYFGSSTYDSRQMSALINSLVEECNQFGIETKSPEEIESLLRSYEHGKKNS